MRGILGIPLKRGNSDVVEAAVYTGSVVAGAATSEGAESDGAGQLTVKPFSVSSGFSGFAVAGDMNAKNKTVSVIKIGLDIPVAITKGKTFTKGKGVFLAATGLLVPEGDDGAVYQVNGTIRRSEFTGLDNAGAEKSSVTIDLFGGGAEFTATT